MLKITCFGIGHWFDKIDQGKNNILIQLGNSWNGISETGFGAGCAPNESTENTRILHIYIYSIYLCL